MGSISHLDVGWPNDLLCPVESNRIDAVQSLSLGLEEALHNFHSCLIRRLSLCEEAKPRLLQTHGSTTRHGSEIIFDNSAPADSRYL